MKIIYGVLTCLAIIFSLCTCTERDKNGRPIDTTTSGVIKIAVDESLRPLIEAEIDTFEGIYRQAKIEVQYMSEGEAITALVKDSVIMAITTRQLGTEELKVFKAIFIEPTQRAIAKDAIALILNKTNNDSLFRFNQLQDIAAGKLTNWNQFNPKNKLGGIEIVFDNPQSGMVRFLNDSVLHMDKLPTNFYALNSNAAVIDYVSKKPNAVGLIGVSWVSDSDDSTANSFLDNIRVAAVAKDSGFYKPYQAYIATHEYPLRRNIYMVSREARSGLATGFITFVASDRGQRIVLKLGLVPVTMPIRIVQVNTQPLN
jgi:phosphate transport system substrate-binding protein